MDDVTKTELLWSRGPVALPDSVAAARDGEVVIVRLTRRHKRNAINAEMLGGIRAVFINLADDVKAAVICSDGDDFSAGLDLSSLTEKDAAESMFMSFDWHRTFDEVQRGRVPVVSVLRGAVIGAGLELASATHIRVAEPTAYYGLPEGQRGIFLGGGGSVRLTRLIGLSRVYDLMMTGRTIDAREGYQFGFAQYLVGEGEGLAKATEIARRIARNAPLSNFAMIQALPRIAESGLDEGFFTEALVSGVVSSSGEAKERLHAFLQKRAAKVAKPGQ